MLSLKSDIGKKGTRTKLSESKREMPAKGTLGGRGVGTALSRFLGLMKRRTLNGMSAMIDV